MKLTDLLLSVQESTVCIKPWLLLLVGKKWAWSSDRVCSPASQSHKHS